MLRYNYPELVRLSFGVFLEIELTAESLFAHLISVILS